MGEWCSPLLKCLLGCSAPDNPLNVGLIAGELCLLTETRDKAALHHLFPPLVLCLSYAPYILLCSLSLAEPLFPPALCCIEHLLCAGLYSRCCRESGTRVGLSYLQGALDQMEAHRSGWGALLTGTKAHM